MAESIRLAQYFKMAVPNKPGEAVARLDTVKGAGVNLLAFSGFPRGGKAQLDFVPEDPARFQAVAKYHKWKLQGPKACFVVQGDDRVGAVADMLERLVDAKINVTAADAVNAGKGRFAVLIFVKPGSVKKAAAALGVSEPHS
ncbi:MAG: hypothetical protein FJ248_06705 [Nitrospira sp.]|nr:hypothetical protein [Nitrospira sp.]